MLRWLADDPYATIRSSIADALEEQVAGSQLKEFRVISAPQWLSGVRPHEEGDSKFILVRAGVAFEFELSVESEGALHQLSGVRPHGSGFTLTSPANKSNEFGWISTATWPPLVQKESS